MNERERSGGNMVHRNLLRWQVGLFSCALLFTTDQHSRLLAQATPTAEPLPAAWRDLADQDPELAYRAVWRLVQNPEPAVKLLRQELKPVPSPDEAKIKGWLKDLGSDTFVARSHAHGDVGRFLARWPVARHGGTRWTGHTLGLGQGQSDRDHELPLIQ
jgi:hypothetical protein